MEDMLENIEERAEDADAKGTAESENARNVKKYSDEDLDRIIQKKFAKWNEKSSRQQQRQEKEDELDAREKKLRIRELRADVKDRLTEDGHPAALAEFINYESDEQMEESYEKITRIMDEQRRAWETAQEARRAIGAAPRSYRTSAADPIRKAFSNH